jgi:cyclophilin family peptidyl-prolyl cis-trans isomerase
LQDAERPIRHSHAERGNEKRVVSGMERSGFPETNEKQRFFLQDAERPIRHSHAERGNENSGVQGVPCTRFYQVPTS